MPSLSPLQIVFMAYNAIVGVAVGASSAFNPWFEQLGLPLFGWLIAAMFAFEVVAGLTMKVHPSAAISMGTRIAALSLSCLACFLMASILKPA
jgi:hypothetical protein